ncbi:hypothetical protein FOZ63_011959, partial [Perkinsus olseni]
FDRGGHYDSRERMSIREGRGWGTGRPPVARHGSSILDRASGVEVLPSGGEGYNRRATVGGWGDRRSLEVLPPSQGRRHSGEGHIGVPSSEERPQDGAGTLQRPMRKSVAPDRGSVTERIREVVPGRQARPDQAYAHEGWEGSSSGRPSRSGSVEVLPGRGRSSIEVIPRREEARRPEVLADKGSAGMPDYHHYHERIEITSGAKQLVRDESVDISRVVEAAPLEESILVEEAPPPLVGSGPRPAEDDGTKSPASSLPSDRRDERPSLLTMPYRSALSTREEDALLRLHGAETTEELGSGFVTMPRDWVRDAIKRDFRRAEAAKRGGFGSIHRPRTRQEKKVHVETLDK